MSKKTIGNVIENCRDELIEGTYIQSEEEMLNKDSFLVESKLSMFMMLDNFERIIGSTE
jgi:hypothetical protein